MRFNHYSVLANEVIEGLAVQRGGIYVDGTVGGAGHARLLQERGGIVIGIDRDLDAIAAAKERLGDEATLVHGAFAELDKILDDLKIGRINGALLDLGVSSHQLDTPKRGFSYHNDALLDMRMDASCGKTAADVVNGYEQSELARVLREYGEERYAGKIARKICEHRPVNTTAQLVEIIKKAIPPKVRFADKHPAKRTFQAIRVEVNGELEQLKSGIRVFANRLCPKGRLAIITFHSLEDRIVKEVFAELVGGKCVCPKGMPVCSCSAEKGEFEQVNKKPILPSEKELHENTRSSSAKLRILERRGFYV